MPVGCHHCAGEMAAGGMAVDHHAAAGAQPQEQARVPDLLDDLGDRHFGTEVVTDDRHRHAAGIEPARHVAEQRRIERAPVAAMDEQRQRGGHAGAGREQVDELPQGLAVAQSQFRAPFLHRLGTIVLGLARPAREDVRVLGYAGAVVVFGFVVDGHALSPCGVSLSSLPARGERQGRRVRPLPFVESKLCLAR